MIENLKLKTWLGCLKDLAKDKIFDSPNLKWKNAVSCSLLESYLNRFDNIILRKNLDEDIILQSLPQKIRDKINTKSSTVAERLRIILDYVSGMTDGFFMRQASAFYDPASVKAISYPF